MTAAATETLKQEASAMKFNELEADIADIPWPSWKEEYVKKGFKDAGPISPAVEAMLAPGSQCRPNAGSVRSLSSDSNNSIVLKLSGDTVSAPQVKASHATTRTLSHNMSLQSNLSQLMKGFSGLPHGHVDYGDDDDDLNKEYVRMSCIIVVRFQEVALEAAYQDFFLKKRRHRASYACSLIAALSLGFALANCGPPYDECGLFRRVTGFAISAGMSSVALLSYRGGNLADCFNNLCYDPLLCGMSLLIIFLYSMTSDRIAKHLELPDQTWSLVPMQESNYNMGLGLTFAFLMVWLDLRLHWQLLTYVIGIPLAIGLMLKYGSIAFYLEETAREYHYDMDGNSTTHQIWPYENGVLVRGFFLSLISICAYAIARQNEVNHRYAFAKNYFLCLKIERHRRLFEAQSDSHEKKLAHLQTFYKGGLSTVPLAGEVTQRLEISAKLNTSTCLADSAVSHQILDSPTPNVKLAADLARCMCDPMHLRNIADSIRDPSYSLQCFYADCQKGLPELLLGRGHEFYFQKTVGSLFIAYWLLRLDLDGRECFCLGVDRDWNTNAKPPGSIIDNVKNHGFGSLSQLQKCLLFLNDMEWASIQDLVLQAGCAHQSAHVAEHVSSLLSILAIWNLMQNPDYLPNVGPEHSPYHGYHCGSVIEDRALALQYYLDFFPHLLPSFMCLPSACQRILRLSFSPKGRQFDLLFSTHAEYPSGAKFSSFKAAMSAGTRSVDIAMHILAWLVSLAASSGNPFNGAEHLIGNIAPSSLSGALRMVPHILKLAGQNETEVDEHCLKACCHSDVSGLVNAVGEDGSIVALMRIAIMTSSDHAELKECLGILPAEARNNIIEELSYTGVAGQFYQGRTTSKKGPAFILDGLPLFMQRYSGRKQDMCTIFMALNTVLRAARLAWPVEPDLQGTCITLRLGALAESSPVGGHSSLQSESLASPSDLRELLQPTTGEFWTLVGGKDAALGLLELIRPARLNELKSDGTLFHILDFQEVQEHVKKLSSSNKVRPHLHGKWKCIETFGLDEFLKAMGIGWMQRAAASKAPWPTWVFKQEGDQIAFINQSALGDLREDIHVGGPEYIVTDGWKREIKCNASWEGDSLIILKSGPEGKFREIRTIGTNDLLFKVQNVNEDTFPEWGRRFTRIS